MTQIVEVPGIGRVEFPDGMSDAQIVSAIKSNLKTPDAIERGAKSFASNMPFMQQIAAGYGAALPTAISGIKQAMLSPPPGRMGQELLSKSTRETLKNIQSEIDESKRLNAPLMSTGGGLLGNIAGNIALFAPTAAIPGANTYTGAGVIGAGLGAIQPVATGESRGANVALGAVAGPAGQAIGRGVGRAFRPVQSTLTPEAERLAAVARSEGIPLTVGQMTGSKPLRIAESVMENLPFTAGPQAAVKQAQQGAFTSAALKRAGIEGETVATPGVLGSRKAALGKTFEDIASKSTLNFNKGLTDDLAGIVGKASQELTPQDAGRIARAVDSILSNVDEAGNMAGSQYQAWRTPLSRMARGGTEPAYYFGQIKKSLDSAFMQQVSGESAEAWKTASKQYANLKTILDAMGGAGAGTKTGVLGPAQLEGALTKSVGREGKALGRGDLNELVGAGRMFVSESIPDSGTAQRLMIQNLLTGNVPGALGGAGIGYYQGRTPESAFTGAMLGAGGTLLAPRLAQSAMMSSPQYFSRGLLSLTPEQLALIAAASRTGVLGSSQSLLMNK